MKRLVMMPIRMRNTFKYMKATKMPASDIVIRSAARMSGYGVKEVTRATRATDAMIKWGDGIGKECEANFCSSPGTNNIEGVDGYLSAPADIENNEHDEADGIYMHEGVNVKAGIFCS